MKSYTGLYLYLFSLSVTHSVLCDLLNISMVGTVDPALDFSIQCSQLCSLYKVTVITAGYFDLNITNINVTM